MIENVHQSLLESNGSLPEYELMSGGCYIGLGRRQRTPDFARLLLSLRLIMILVARILIVFPESLYEMFLPQIGFFSSF